MTKPSTDETVLGELLANRRALIVVGPGGVGKTTTSAALAVRAARDGKRVLVLTVDPAKRLANSLGLAALGNEETRIDDALFDSANVPLNGGALFGMMLDIKRTFDDLVERHAPNDDVKQRIFSNPFYDQASTALAGSQEYMAMEKLYEIRERDNYDLVILDTPPTSNALDFLSAPDRLEDFLGSSSTRMLLKGMKAAGKLGLGFLRLNTRIMRGLNKFVGADTFLALLEFIQSFHEMYDGFKERAGRVRTILRSPDVAFIVVTSTEQSSIDEASFFHEQLKRSQMPFGAMVVNRTRQSYLEGTSQAGLAARVAEAVEPHVDTAAPAVGERAAWAVERYEALAAVDGERTDALRAHLGKTGDSLVPVPLFERDIHDIASLSAFADHVVAGS